MTTPPDAAPRLAGAVDAVGGYRALAARDPRFDGRLWFGVTTTGVYCRPVCPARTPRPEHVRLFASPAAAVAAGYRACRRCRPDAAPGSRGWDQRGDLAARALRLIAAGVVDEDGVAGLAATLHVSARHLHRCLVAEVGAGPLQLALSRRAQTARLLVDQTDLPLAAVAFSAGFASIRQFNDVMRREFGVAPSALRRDRRPGPDGREPVAEGASTVLRLAVREPFDVDALLGHLAARAVPGLEAVDPDRGCAERLLRLPTGPARVRMARVPGPRGTGSVQVTITGAALADLAACVRTVRRWWDLDAEPAATAAVLAADPALGPLVAARPGLRVPGYPEPFEAVLRAVAGQHISVRAARTVLGRLVDPGTGLLPDPVEVSAAGPGALTAAGLTGARARALVAVAEAVAGGRLALDPAADRAEVRARLTGLPGIGAWTAEYVALRGLADPDAFPATDLGLRRAWAGLGHDPAGLARAADRWRPWRAYAAQHLWSAAGPARAPATDPDLDHPTGRTRSA